MRKNEFRMNLWKHMETGSFSDMKTFIFIIFGNIIGYLCIDLRKHLIINVVVQCNPVYCDIDNFDTLQFDII